MIKPGIRIGVIVLLFTSVWTWNQDQSKTRKLTGNVQPRLLAATRDGDDLLNLLYNLSLEVQGSFDPKDDNFAIRVCSNDPLPLALPLASGDPFLTTIKLEKAGVPKARIYYLRQNKSCSLAANGYAPTEYWLVPKGAQFPDHVEARSATNLLGFQFTHHDQLEKGDRHEIDEIQNLTPKSYAEVLEKVVALLKEHTNARAVIQGFYYTHAPSAELNKRVTETQRYLTSNGIAQYRIHTKRMNWGPRSSAPEKYPNIFVVIEN
ncbi:MAG TPA: hypothetical protein VJP89_05595 [Pyrinomonadaceae bacterium]|nr:hypothetical protein [Pyrinomonadaceae bacterium]